MVVTALDKDKLPADILMLIVGKTRPAAEESAHLSTAEARRQSPPLPDWLGRA